MKIKYNTPAISVEELIKADVLCSSNPGPNPVTTPSPDNNGVTNNDWNGLSKFI